MADKKNVTDVKLEAYTKGMQSNYSHYIASPNSWSYLENLDVDRQGVLSTRANVFQAGTSSNAFQGIIPFERGLITRFLIKSGTACFNQQANVPGTGALNSSSITFSDADSLLRGDVCQGVTVFAAAGTNGVRFTSDGFTATDFATPRLGMPNYIDLVSAGFAGRIWGAISNGTPSSFEQDQVYYSDVIPSSGIANTTGSGQYLKVNTGGKWITGLVQFNNVLYVFTLDSIFRIYNTQSLDNAPIANVGAIRQECIIKTQDAIYFLHFSGVYRLDGGGVTKISQDIDDFIQSINLTNLNAGNNYTRRTYSWFDEQSITFSLDVNGGWGGISTDVDRTYAIRYNYIYKTWNVVSLKDFRVHAAHTRFFSSPSGGVADLANISPLTMIAGQNLTTNTYVAGLFDIPTYADGGKPMQNSNAGEPIGDWCNFGDRSSNNLIRPIFCNGETQWLDFGAENHLKTITGISIASESAGGFQLLYQIDNQDEEKSDRKNSVWQEIGTLSDNYVTFFRDFNSKDFYRIKFKISGQTYGRNTQIGQIVLLNITDLGYGNN